MLAFGRSIHTRGAEIHVIGRKEVVYYQSQGIDLTPFEGGAAGLFAGRYDSHHVS